MRKLITLMCVATFAGCGGGGGSDQTCEYTLLFNGDEITSAYAEELGYPVVPGEGTADIVRIIESGDMQKILDKILPDVIIVSAGKWDIEVHSNPDQTDYEFNLTKILEYYKTQVPYVVFQYTLLDDRPGYDQKVIRYNEVAKRVVEATGVIGYDPLVNVPELLPEAFQGWFATEFECVPI